MGVAESEACTGEEGIELESAVADGLLTLAELDPLPSQVMGTATRYRETLHPTGGAVRPALEITATGQLHDGRTFTLENSGSSGGIQTVIHLD